MKILLGTHHLEVRAGSELFTAELASAFQARGHEVAVFTFFKGALADEITGRGIPVFDSDERETIARLTPDIVQTNHLPCAHFLRTVIPESVRLHAMLGVLPPLESPPLDADAYSLGLVVSEEVRDRVSRSSFGHQVRMEIFRNWFDDHAVVVAERRHRPPVLRAAVISNHVAPELTDVLTTLQAAGDVEADYFGLAGRSVVVDGSLLTQYDLVISIGRTTLLAAACGVPCIMADIHGSDGLLTADNLDMVRAVNFSGRLRKLPITKAHLQDALWKLDAHDCESLRRRVTSEYSLSCRAEWLLVYRTLLADQGDPARNPPQHSPPAEGLVHAEIAAEVRQLRRALIDTRAKLHEIANPGASKAV